MADCTAAMNELQQVARGNNRLAEAGALQVKLDAGNTDCVGGRSVAHVSPCAKSHPRAHTLHSFPLVNPNARALQPS